MRLSAHVYFVDGDMIVGTRGYAVVRVVLPTITAPSWSVRKIVQMDLSMSYTVAVAVGSTVSVAIGASVRVAAAVAV